MNREEERAIEHDCARLVAQCANLNDLGAWEEFADLFIACGRLARPTASDDAIVGRDAILAAFRARPQRRARHLCTSIFVRAVDAHESTGECAIALFLADDVVKIGTFVDRFRRTGAGWRFAERLGSLTFP